MSSLFAAARACHQAGRLAEAEALYRRHLAGRPDDPDALAAFGVLLQQSGRPRQAAAVLQPVVAARPGDALARNNLGAALFALGQFDEAAVQWRRARELSPADPDIAVNLGLLEARLGRFVAAVGQFRSVLARHRAHAAALSGLANALRELGEDEPARRAYRLLLVLRPDEAAAWNNLGLLHRAHGRTAAAVSCHRRALRLQPVPEAAKNLGHALGELGRREDAAAAYRAATSLVPDDAGSWLWLAGALRPQGRIEAALAAYGRAALIEPENFTARIRHAAAMPVIPWSREDIEQHRRRLAEELEAIAADGLRVADPHAADGPTNFFLAYHNLDDRPLQERLAQIYRRACPALDWTAPHCGAPSPRRKRLRLGLCSAFFRRHTIGRLNVGIVEHLDRSRFEVVLIRAPGQARDSLQEVFDRAADAVVTLPDTLFAARQCVADLELDVLHYTDIGMSSLLYFLAFARLAPLQTTTWGHPDTSGLTSLDLFLSAETLEPARAEAFYTERLVRLPRLGTCYHRPATPPAGDRAHFGLPAGAHLYVCVQTLFKFHPDDDRVFARLLRGDPAGLLILVGGRDSHWNERLQARIGQSFPDILPRIRFLPPMGHDAFLTLLASADVLLDARYFSGGNTSLEAFAAGTPVAAWDDAPFMRGRLTRAMYQAMDLPDYAVRGEDAYVDLAHRLAGDPSARAAARAAIAERADALFHDTAAVRALESAWLG